MSANCLLLQLLTKVIFAYGCWLRCEVTKRGTDCQIFSLQFFGCSESDAWSIALQTGARNVSTSVMIANTAKSAAVAKPCIAAVALQNVIGNLMVMVWGNRGKSSPHEAGSKR